MPTYRTTDGHLAPSLVALFTEVDKRWPNRSRKSDGWIGDTAHQTRQSDHNPDPFPGGVVRAVDITVNGIDVEELLRAVVGDPRVWYVIYNRRIASATKGWGWQDYTGPNPHTAHVHISIKHTPSAESGTTRWLDAPKAPKPPAAAPEEDNEMWNATEAEKIEKKYVMAHQLWLAQTAAERSVSDALAAKLLAEGKSVPETLAEVEKIWKPIAAVQAKGLGK